MTTSIKDKIKNIFTDSMWSIAGLVLMNVVIQFLVYPFWNKNLGSEMYGNVIYLISLMNVFSISVGSSCNYCRMTEIAKGKTYNSDYVIILLFSSVLAVVYSLTAIQISGIEFSSGNIVLYAILSVATMWRYYGDVEFKMNTNFKGFFCYYLTMCIGYGVGIVLFKLTGAWALALIPGEIAGLVFVFIKGNIFKIKEKIDFHRMINVMKLVALLFASEALINAILNGDRILLKALLSGSAVAMYYQVSLLGKTVALITAPLNGVIMGYLAKYNGKLSKKVMNIITAISVGAIIVATFLSIVGSYILIPILYPKEYPNIKEWFLLGNLPQVIFFVSDIVSVILLRFANARYRLYGNILYAVSFCSLCIPFARIYGFKGFCIGMLMASVVRFVSAVVLCYMKAVKKSDKSLISE